MTGGQQQQAPMHDLSRYHSAQDGVYHRALDELQAGRKRSHWMWFIFPQIAGLGMSATSRRYAITSLDEARDYLADPVLGARLRESVAAVLEHGDRTAHEIFGHPDDMKFRSCLTLFEAADPGETLFGDALAEFYDGVRDPRTLELLNA